MLKYFFHQRVFISDNISMADGGGDTPTEGQLGPPDLIPHIIPVDLGKFSISILGYMPGLAKKIQPEKKT